MTRSSTGGDGQLSSSSSRYPAVASRQLVVVVASLAAVGVSALILLVVLGRDGSNAPTSAKSSSAAAPNADTTPARTVKAPSVSVKVKLPTQGRLGMGNEGANVTQLQRALVVVGLDPGARDGIFGRKTQRAVIAFQKQHNLVADGVVGAKTAAALNAALAESAR